MIRLPQLLTALALLSSACGGSHGSGTAPGDSGTRDGHETHDAAPTADAHDARATTKDSGSDAHTALSVKVMVINMATLEALAFSGLGWTTNIPVVGLPSATPNVRCNASDVCEVTLGMGYANAASSTMALLSSAAFDLTQTYFIIAGIAGVDPAQGTVGSAAWARYVVDIGIAHEIDAREMPSGWPYGYFGLGASSPTAAPTITAGTEMYQINENLLQQAYTLSKGLTLTDAPGAIAYRANYTSAPANQPPTVLQCDTTSSDTWFAGVALTARADAWMKLFTGGKGVACMSAQEDNSTLTALHRGSLSGKVDMNRVAVLRSASDFEAPYPGQTDSASLLTYLEQGGLGPSPANLFVAAKPLIDAIIANWATWKSGAPAP